MKRTWIGAGVLALLLAAGLLTGAAMDRRVSPGAETLRDAAQAARDEDWEKAEALTDSVRADWERFRPLAEVLITSEDLQEIHGSFEQLRAYVREDGPAYSALCIALARQLEALAQIHSCALGNLF